MLRVFTVTRISSRDEGGGRGGFKGGARDYVTGPVTRCLSAQSPYQGCL